MIYEIDKIDLRIKFPQSVQNQFTFYYSNQKVYGKQAESAKRHDKGFMYVDVKLELIKNTELQLIMERIYHDVFGMTPTLR